MSLESRVKRLEDKVFGNTTPPPIEPEPQPKPPEGIGNRDFFGIKEIFPTTPNGRIFNAPLTTGNERTIRSGQRDGRLGS